MEVGVVLLLGIGLYFWNLSRAASNLTYFPGNITGFSLSGVSPVIYADLVVQNTNNVSFTLNSLAGTVTSDDTQIGNISNFVPVQIPGNSQAVIPLTLLLQPIALVNDVIGIITGGSGSRTVKIEGTVNANGIQAPFALSYKIGF